MAIWRFLEELGYFDDEPSNVSNYVVKSYSETFQTSGRLDSEYYQSKYDRLFEQLSKLNSCKLSELVLMEKSVEPGSGYYLDKGVPFVRVQDLSCEGIKDTRVYLDRKEWSDAPRPKTGTILFSKDGSVGIAYQVQGDDPEMITSSAILHLNLKANKVLPEYLTLMLNSPVVQLQAERDAGGSIINHWKPSEIANVQVPIIAEEKQSEISSLIRSSYNHRRESKKYLEVAIRAVEMAIETNENTALQYIESELAEMRQA